MLNCRCNPEKCREVPKVSRIDTTPEKNEPFLCLWVFSHGSAVCDVTDTTRECWYWPQQKQMETLGKSNKHWILSQELTKKQLFPLLVWNRPLNLRKVGRRNCCRRNGSKNTTLPIQSSLFLGDRQIGNHHGHLAVKCLQFFLLGILERDGLLQIGN